jgi:hypothetical protein
MCDPIRRGKRQLSDEFDLLINVDMLLQSVERRAK